MRTLNETMASRVAAVMLAALVAGFAFLLLLQTALADGTDAALGDAGKGSVTQDGVVYEYQIANGEAAVTSIAKAADNAAETYAAIIPESVTTGDGNSYLVTALAENVMGTDISSKSNSELTAVTLPSKLLQVGDQAFAQCTALRSVTFALDEDGASHVESIGSYAFYGTSVSELSLPDSLTTVGDYAFMDISGLKSLRLPATQTSWGRYPFQSSGISSSLEIPEGCVIVPRLSGSATSISIPSSVAGTLRLDFGSANSLELAQDSSITDLTLSFGALDSLVIPESVQALDLRGACSSVTFPSSLQLLKRYRMAGQEEIVIPASVKTIGASAFLNNTDLKKVTFEEGSQLASIGMYAFAGCTALEEVDMKEGLMLLGNFMFSGCSSLRSVIIPASVSTTDIAPFIDCSSLESISFAPGSNLTRFTASLATSCPSLKTVSLPDGLETILISTKYKLLDTCPALERVYTYTPDVSFTTSDFNDCGDFALYGWGVEGAVMDFAEDEGIQFVAFAELDTSFYSGKANTQVTLDSTGQPKAVCSFTPATGFDYQRELVEGEDFTKTAVTVNGRACWQVEGNNVTCFGAAVVPQLTDLAGASMSAIGTQLLGSRACTPKPAITYAGETLVAGRDYTLSYAGNDTPGTATVTALGMGSYTGTLSGTFKVASAASISGSDRAANANSAEDAATDASADFAAEAAGDVAALLGSQDAASQALAIEASSNGWSSTAVVTCADDAGLAISAAAYAGAVGGPLLYTDADGTLGESTLAVLKRYGSVVVVGGYAQVDASADTALSNEVRVAGSSVAATSAALASYGVKQGVYSSEWSMYLVSRGDASSFMTWASVAAAKKAPLVVFSGKGADAVSFARESGSAFAGYTVLERTSGSSNAVLNRMQTILLARG